MFKWLSSLFGSSSAPADNTPAVPATDTQEEQTNVSEEEVSTTEESVAPASEEEGKEEAVNMDTESSEETPVEENATESTPEEEVKE